MFLERESRLRGFLLEIDKKKKQARPQSGSVCVHFEYCHRISFQIIRCILNSAACIHTRGFAPLCVFSGAAAANRKNLSCWLILKEQSRRKNIFTQRQIIMLRVSFYGRTILREQKCNPRPHTYLYTSAGKLYAPDFTFKTLSLACERRGQGRNVCEFHPDIEMFATLSSVHASLSFDFANIVNHTQKINV